LKLGHEDGQTTGGCQSESELILEPENWGRMRNTYVMSWCWIPSWGTLHADNVCHWSKPLEQESKHSSWLFIQRTSPFPRLSIHGLGWKMCFCFPAAWDHREGEPPTICLHSFQWSPHNLAPHSLSVFLDSSAAYPLLLPFASGTTG
jgi:hypothetical protein